jgi:lipocalin-like protein
MAKPAATALLLLAIGVSSGDTLAQSAGELVGTWTLVSSVSEKDGKKVHQFGPDAEGMMSLDSQGYFMITIIGADIPRFASNNRNSGTAEENKAVVQNSIATFGTYSFSSDDNSIIFKPERNTFPNWSGTSQKRLITSATKDELAYAIPALQ